MKQILIFSSAIVLLFFQTGCGPRIKGNGNITEISHKVGNFNSINVSGMFQVFIKQGKHTDLMIKADENLHEYITVEERDNAINISQEATIIGSDELAVFITVKDIRAIDLSGAVELKNKSLIKTRQLSIDGSGAVNVDLELETENLSINLSGASETHLKGKAKKARIDISGAGEIQAFELVTGSMDIELSGAASAQVNTQKKLSVDISGAGAVEYMGSPKLTRDISGAGSIKKRGE